MKNLLKLVVLLVAIAGLYIFASNIHSIIQPASEELANVTSTIVPTSAPTAEPTVAPTSTPVAEPTVAVTSPTIPEPTIENVTDPIIKVVVVTPEPTDTTTSNIKVVVCTPEPTAIPTTTPTTEPVTVDGILELHQIYAGCGDAYLLRTDDFTIMIDGGENISKSGGKVRQRVLNYLEDAGVKTLDAYIGTHWHGDHVENMYVILKKFGDSNTVIYGNTPKLPDGYSIPSGKGNYVQMKDGDTFNFGDTIIKCMGPYKLSNLENENSLNFLITFGKTKIFMTGDYVHKEVVDKYSEELKHVDVYKMAHHGLPISNYSGSPDVLPTLNPDIVLVPANSSSNTKNLLSKLGISSKVYDGKNGQHVVVKTDGNELTVSTEK